MTLRDAKGRRLKSATRENAEARLIRKLQKESLRANGDPAKVRSAKTKAKKQ